MLASLAVLSNSSILEPRAHRFLEAWKGQWIPAAEKGEEYPEIFNAEFVKLLVRIPEFLTEPERVFYDRLNLIGRVRGAASLRLQVKVKGGFTPSDVDLTRYTKILCSTCGHRRSFTLMKEGTCGLCLTDEPWSKDSPEPSDDGSNMVACIKCHMLYAVVNKGSLRIPPKCYYCRNAEPAETVCCQACGNEYAAPTAAHRTEDFVCAHCTKSPSAGYSVREVRMDALMRENPQLIGCLGLPPSTRELIFDRMSLYKLWMSHGKELIASTELTVRALNWSGKPIVQVAELICSMRESVLKGRLQETCNLCFEDKSLSAIDSACGHCSNLVCKDCLKHWYGKLAPGRLYVPSEGLCPFCKRTPKVKLLRSFNPAACRLQGRRNLVLRADMHYAWCRSCFQIKDLAARECTREPPQVDNFECEDCRSVKLLASAEAMARAKSCPGCKSPCLKISGCNHITCPVCSIHWCWQCANQFPYGEIYAHMEAVHGGIGLDDAADFDED